METHLTMNREEISTSPHTADFVDWRSLRPIDDIHPEGQRVNLGDEVPFDGDICLFRSNRGKELEITPHVHLVRRRVARPKQQKTRGSWFGNFDAGNDLISTEGLVGTNAHRLGLSLHDVAFGVGAEIAPDNGVRKYFAHILAKDNRNRVLREFGIQSSNGVDSRRAMFIGILCQQPEIRRVEIWATHENGDPVDFAINRLEISYE